MELERKSQIELVDTGREEEGWKKNGGKKHDRKSGHLQDRDRVTSQRFIKEESRFHSCWVGGGGRSADPRGSARLGSA